MPRRGAAALLCAISTWCAAPMAHAQDDRPETRTTDGSRARILFDRGIALEDAGDRRGAVAQFRASLAVEPSDRTSVNLARVLAQLGHVAESAQLLRAIMLDPGSDLLIRDAARTLLSRVSPRVATLQVELRGPSSGRVLLLDDRPVPTEAASAGIGIDPGRHVVSVSDGAGRLVSRQVVTAEPGGSVEAVLTVAPSPAQVAIAAAEPGGEPDESEPLTARWWFWGGAGVVVVAAAVAVTLLVTSSGPAPADGDVDPIYVGGG